MFRRRHTRRRGLGLVDVTIAVTVLVVGLLAAVTAALSGVRLARTDIETRCAVQAAAHVLDEIRATPFDTVVATYHGVSRQLSTVAEGAPRGRVHTTVVEEATGFTRWPVLLVTVRVELDGVTGSRATEVATYLIDTKPAGLP